MISIDFETYLISEEMPSPKPVCLSVYDGKKTFLAVGMDEMEKALEQIFKTKQLIIAHNMVFEALVIYKWFPKLQHYIWEASEKGLLFCTKIYEKLLNNTRRKTAHRLTLAALVQAYFNKDISASKGADAWRLRYNELDGIPIEEWPQEAIDYAIDDAVYTYDIAKIQKSVELDYQLHVETEICLNLMGQNGIKINMDRVKQTEKEMFEYLLPRYEYLISEGFMVYDEKKQKYRKKMNALREHIAHTFEELEYTIKGTVATSTEALAKYIVQKEDKVVSNFLEMAQYEKALTAFINNLKLAEKGIIRSSYNGCVDTGRTSCSKSRAYPSLNMQQMPRGLTGVTWDIRNCFVPREGFKIVSIDYAGLELCAAANQLYKIFGQSNMRDFLNSGDEPQDSHSNYAARLRTIAGKPTSYEEMKANKKKDGYKEYRQYAKPQNLGYPGGIGIDSMDYLCAREGIKVKKEIIHKSKDEKQIDRLVYNYKFKYPSIRKKRLDRETWALEVNELVLLKKEYLELYPELGKFLREEHGHHTTGEKLRTKNDFGEWEWEDAYTYDVGGFKRNYCTYTAFCNGSLMQTPSAIGAKKMANAIIKEYFNHPDMNPLAFIHDEILFEVRENDNMYKIIDDIAQTMLEEMADILPNVRISVEAELMDYWMKAGGSWSKQYWIDPYKEYIRSK